MDRSRARYPQPAICVAAGRRELAPESRAHVLCQCLVLPGICYRVLRSHDIRHRRRLADRGAGDGGQPRQAVAICFDLGVQARDVRRRGGKGPQRRRRTPPSAPQSTCASLATTSAAGPSQATHDATPSHERRRDSARASWAGMLDPSPVGYPGPGANRCAIGTPSRACCAVATPHRATGRAREWRHSCAASHAACAALQASCTGSVSVPCRRRWCVGCAPP